MAAADIFGLFSKLFKMAQTPAKDKALKKDRKERTLAGPPMAFIVMAMCVILFCRQAAKPPSRPAHPESETQSKRNRNLKVNLNLSEASVQRRPEASITLLFFWRNFRAVGDPHFGISTSFLSISRAIKRKCPRWAGATLRDLNKCYAYLLSHERAWKQSHLLAYLGHFAAFFINDCAAARHLFRSGLSFHSNLI